MRISKTLIRLSIDKEFRFFIQHLPFVPLSERSQLPESPAIYFVIDCKSHIYYIGQSKNIKQRLLNHHLEECFTMLDKPRIFWVQILNDDSRRELEKEYIEWFDPVLNEDNFFGRLLLKRNLVSSLLWQVQIESLFDFDIFAVKRFSKQDILPAVQKVPGRIILLAFAKNTQEHCEEIIYISRVVSSFILFKQKKMLESILNPSEIDSLNYSFISFPKATKLHKNTSYYLRKAFLTPIYSPKYDLKNNRIEKQVAIKPKERDEEKPSFGVGLWWKFISVLIPI